MENIKNIKYLLRDINIVRKKFEEREKNEDNFNMFTILRKESDEVYLHSRFLSALLDPNGPHRLGTIFLNSFLDRIESDFEYDEKSLEVYPNNLNRSEYKEIDICFIDRIGKRAVMVENKIYHKDSNHEDKGQLENYYGKLIEEDKIPEDGIEVYYLTLDGHEPSEDSVKLSGKYPTLQDKVKCISYSVEILDWLRDLVKECYNKPSLRESVIQYIKLIESMTNNDLSLEEIKELSNLIGQNEDNIQSTKVLLDNFIHIKWHTIHDFWQELILEFINRDFKIQYQVENEEIDNLVNGNQKTRRIDLEVQIKFKNVPVWIRNEYDEWLFWGVYTDEENKLSKNLISKLNKLKSGYSVYESDENWLCYKFFGDCEQEKICFSDFSCEGTFNLISGKYRKEIIIKLSNQIEEFINKLHEL